MKFKRTDLFDMELSGAELTGLLYGIARMLSEDSEREASELITAKLIPIIKIDREFDDDCCIEFWADENY